MRNTTITRSHLRALVALPLAAAAVTTGVLSAAPAQAVGGIDGGNISTSGDVPTSVDVAAFGAGDALAAWTKPVVGGTKVYAAIATDGVWGAPKAVTAAPVTNAHDVQALANDAGQLAVVWNQTHAGEEKVRAARLLGNGNWDGSALLSPAVDIEKVISMDADMDGAGRVHVAYEAQNNGVNRVETTMWTPGANPQFTPFPDHTFEPSLDVNPAGDVVMSYYASGNGGEIRVTRRNASVGWLGPKALPWTDDVLDDNVAVVADNGAGAVMMGGMEDGEVRAVVTKVGADGSTGFPQAVSAAGVPTSYRDLAMSPNGTLQASWSAFENDTTYVVRAAVAKPGQDFGTPSMVESSTITTEANVGLISDRGAQVVVHNDDDELTFRHRTNPILIFGGYDAGATNGAFAADMDRDGNAVAVGIVENGFSSYVEGDFLDVAGPQAAMTAPGAVVEAPTFDVAWQVSDSLSGVKNSDVIVRSAAWNGGFAPQQVIGNNVTTSSQVFAGELGGTYCFSVQGVDKANNLGLRSAERCTTVPLDDTALSGKKWKRTAKAGAFNDTATSTKKKGRKLVIAGVKARHLDLIASKAKKGGKVRVYWNGALVRTISLKGKAGQATLPIADFGSIQTGTLKIKVVSRTGKKVSIDGIVAAK